MTADASARPVHETLGHWRPRSAADGEDPSVPVAGTVMVLRDTDAGAEVLMMRRPERGSFAGAWVFPGGKVESGDAGVNEPETARHAAARECAEEVGLALAPADLTPHSRWDPPVGAISRIRTWFYLARDTGASLRTAPDEVQEARWWRPDDMLAAHASGETRLYPPTWVTLTVLAACGDAGSAIAAAEAAGVRTFETVPATPEGPGRVLLWAGDADYEVDGLRAGGQGRHRLDMGALPWRYEVDAPGPA